MDAVQLHRVDAGYIGVHRYHPYEWGVIYMSTVYASDRWTSSSKGCVWHYFGAAEMRTQLGVPRAAQEVKDTTVKANVLRQAHLIATETVDPPSSTCHHV